MRAVRAVIALALAVAVCAFGATLAQEQGRAPLEQAKAPLEQAKTPLEQAKTPLGLPPVPPAVAGSTAMRRLGERLFFDRGLSANNTLSCAMCHIQAQGYASNQSALSIGMEGRSLRRNAPTLYNVVFKKFLFHDGRETDLAAQVWGPLLS
ncbi:MAG: cytochrome-c peroxidase, partial [Methylocystis sp.]